MPSVEMSGGWLVAFWVVIGISTVVTVIGAIVLVAEALGGLSDAHVDRPLDMRQARPRVDPPDYAASDFSPLRRVSGGDTRLDGRVSGNGDGLSRPS